MRCGRPSPTDGSSLTHQLAAWRHGFYAETTKLYDFERRGFDAYVSDYERVKRLASMNQNQYLLDDKEVAYLYLRAFDIPTPTVHGFVQDGSIVWLGEPRKGGLEGLLERAGRLVVKARSGSGGTRFGVLRRDAGTIYVNDHPINDLAAQWGRNLIVSDFIEQHDEMKAVFPRTTNTIRVITMRGRLG